MRTSSYLEIKQALRALARSFSYSIPAVCVLALGIGANTSIYSIVHGVILRPLPYRDANQLVQIVRQQGESEFKVSGSDFEALKQGRLLWNQIAVYQRWSVSFNGNAGPEILRSANVSPNLFDLFQVPPAAGRAFYPDEDQPGRESVAVISDAVWRKHFAADPGIIGKIFLFGAKPYTLIGVAAPGFSFPDADVWFPLTTTDNSSNADKEIVARLNPGVSVRQAQSAADVVAIRVAEKKWKGEQKNLRVISLQEYSNREVRPLTFLLFATSGFILLLACTNVSLSLISSAIEKGGDIAIRQALGARPRHVVQHILTESLVISLLGGFLGVLIAFGGIQTFLNLSGGSQNDNPIRLDLHVLAFTVSISLISGILAGLIPALLSAKQEILSRLGQIGTYSRPAARKLRFRDVILGFQISAALLLLICTVVMLRSTWALSRIDVGFDFHSALVMWTAPPQSYSQGQVKLFYQQVLEGVQALPGVSEAGLTNNGFFFGTHAGGAVIPRTNHGGLSQWVEIRNVSPRLFRAAGMRLLEGRSFDDNDAAISSPGKLVVDETFAQRFWPGQDVLGKMVTIPGNPATEWQIVGVVQGTRDISLREEPVPTVYRDYRNAPSHSMCLVVKTTMYPQVYVHTLRERILSLDANTPPTPAVTLEDLQAKPLEALHASVVLLTIFAAIAVILAAIGIYGAVSYTVIQRTHEIGVRIAMGANRLKVLQLVTGHAIKVTLAGLLLGFLGTFIVTGILSGTISYISRADILSCLFGSVVLVAAAVGAAYIPAQKATQVDPVRCLRRE